MSESILAEYSTFEKLAPRLEIVAKKLKNDANHHDHLVALLIVFMSESGYSSLTCNEERSNAQTWPSNEIDIPDNWKSEDTGIYEISFQINVLPHAICKLVAIPTGDTLILNLLPQNPEMKGHSIAVQTLKYVNCFSEELTGRFLNIKDLSIRFKDHLSNPVCCEYLSDAKMVNPSLQGLPIDLKLRIMELICVRDIMRLAQCSQEFNKLSKEHILWRRLLRRDFTKYEENENYKKQYIKKYRSKCKSLKRSRQCIWQNIRPYVIEVPIMRYQHALPLPMF